MTIKITTPNGGSDSLDFGCAQTAIVATVTGTEVSSGEGKLELKTTTGGTSATKATVLANGSVGIGITAPTSKLHVNGGLIAGAENTQTHPNANAGGGFKAHWNASSGGAETDFYNLYTNADLAFRFWQTTGDGAATALCDISGNGDLKFNSGYGSAATAYGCRAWVNFNGTGTVAIRASGNVSSITDDGAGEYTVNFTVNMPDTNYVAAAVAGRAATTSYARIPTFTTGETKTISAFGYHMLRADQVFAADIAECNIAFFR